MRILGPLLTTSCAALSLGCTGAAGPAGPTAPPPELGADGFYAQYVDAAGIPVIASRAVDPAALEASADMITAMMRHRPDLRAELVRQRYQVAVIGEGEALLDLPENAHWTKPAEDDPRLTRCERIHYEERIGRLTARQYWDARARAIGGQYTAVAEEDVLGRPGSRYYGETILVHEFAHNMLFAIEAVDPALFLAIERAYADALAQDLWFNEYAVTTIQEYWAEGTQFWFDSNRLVVVNGRQILGYRDLAAYDPALYRLLARAYGERHALPGDPFHLHPARVPPGPIPENTAEVC